MQHRGNTSTDRLVSFFELSNTIPEIKRRVFITIQLLSIAVLNVGIAILPLVGFDWFLVFAEVLMLLFLTAMT